MTPSLETQLPCIFQRAAIAANSNESTIRWHNQLTKWTQDAGKLVFDLLPELNPKNMLDVGTGTGSPVLFLAEHLPNCQFEACDISQAGLDIARLLSKESGVTNVNFKKCSAERLIYDEGSFDALCCFFSIMYFEDVEKSIDEFLRVAKTGGTLIFSSWTGKNELLDLIKKEFGIPESARHAEGKDPYLFSNKQAYQNLFKNREIKSLIFHPCSTRLRWAGSEIDLWAFLKHANLVISEILAGYSDENKVQKENSILALLKTFNTGNELVFEADMAFCIVQK